MDGGDDQRIRLKILKKLRKDDVMRRDVSKSHQNSSSLNVEDISFPRAYRKRSTNKKYYKFKNFL